MTVLTRKYLNTIFKEKIYTGQESLKLAVLEMYADKAFIAGASVRA